MMALHHEPRKTWPVFWGSFLRLLFPRQQEAVVVGLVAVDGVLG